MDTRRFITKQHISFKWPLASRDCYLATSLMAARHWRQRSGLRPEFHLQNGPATSRTQHPSFHLLLYSHYFHHHFLRHLYLRQPLFLLLLTLNTFCPIFYLYSVRIFSFIIPYFNILFIIINTNYVELGHPYSQFSFEHLHFLLHFPSQSHTSTFYSSLSTPTT